MCIMEYFGEERGGAFFEQNLLDAITFGLEGGVVGWLQ